MIASIHQPNFMPYAGFFDKAHQADVFIILDNAQFEKNGWQNRNRIKGPNGPQWLTVPVIHRFSQTITETRIDGRAPWRRKHWNAIVSNYRKAPFFEHYASPFEEVYQQEWSGLLDLNLRLIRLFFRLLGLETPLHLASEFPVESTASERLAALCQHVGAETYLAGAGGHAYMDRAPFEARHIRIAYQEYHHPVYPQLFGAFVSHLSALDLLMNCGDRSLAILRGAGAIEEKS
jgi:hypothetical protein